LVNNPLVSIIIVNWNGLQYLEKCFDSLMNLNYKNYEIIFVDNGSIDNSVDYIKNNYPNTKIIINTENLGFAEANNQGVKECSGDYILFLNNDTHVRDDFLTKLVNTMANDSNVGACQSKMLLMDKPSSLDATGSFLTFTGFLTHEGIWEKDIGQYDEYREIFSAKGASMLVRRSVLDEVGIFDKDFFAYFEETDLCWRIWLAGYSIVFVPDSVIFHKMGATSIRMRNTFIEFHSFKNRICSLLKNLDIINLIKIVPLHIILCLGVCVLYIFMLKPRNSVAIIRAIGWNILNIKSTLEKRNIVQNQIRKVTDNQVFSTNMKKVDIKHYIGFALSYCAIK